MRNGIGEYRGKRKDAGAWAYGSLAIDGIGRTSILVNGANMAVSQWHEVDPATVGEYSGRTDKNKKKIYEGDKFDDDDGGYLVVEYDDRRAAFILAQYNQSMYLNENGGEEYGDFKRLDECYFQEYFIDNMEVIGNVHDQPAGGAR